jgi:hypothetical protein
MKVDNNDFPYCWHATKDIRPAALASPNPHFKYHIMLIIFLNYFLKTVDQTSKGIKFPWLLCATQHK